MAHTPGPWAVGEHRGVWVGPVISAAGGKKGIAFVCLSSESDATARLIAAAPELLAALKEVAEECEYRLRKGEDSGDRHTLKLCRAAISKAEGKGE